MQGGMEVTLSAHATLTSTTTKQVWARPPIDVDFQVLMFTASGLIVRFLKVFEKGNYQSVKWVRYLTKASGSYQIRVSRPVPSLEKQVVLIHDLDLVLRYIPTCILVAVLLGIYQLFRASQATIQGRALLEMPLSTPCLDGMVHLCIIHIHIRLRPEPRELQPRSTMWDSRQKVGCALAQAGDVPEIPGYSELSAATITTVCPLGNGLRQIPPS